MPSKHGRRYNVTPKDFTEAWEASSSADEVAARLGMPKPVVMARAHAYRVAGVNLKRMPRSPGTKRIDVAGLNALIDAMEEETGPLPRPSRPRKKKIEVDADAIDAVRRAVVDEVAGSLEKRGE